MSRPDILASLYFTAVIGAVGGTMAYLMGASEALAVGITTLCLPMGWACRCGVKS